MDGTTVQSYFTNEVKAMLDAYRNFEVLIPAQNGGGAGHRGEDGRFVENLIRSFLCKYLPKELEVLTGFIKRPAVKVGKNNNSRKNEKDSHSTQLDIIIYDSAHYPIFLRSNDTVIVPPEGVIAIISVKKYLRKKYIVKELSALKNAAKLCRCGKLRGPYLALLSMSSDIKMNRKSTYERIFNNMKSEYDGDSKISFDEMVGYIGSLKEWGIFKLRPENKKPKDAKYRLFVLKDTSDLNLGLQFLITGILSVYYDNSRTTITRPGFTGFPDYSMCSKELGTITAKVAAKIAK